MAVWQVRADRGGRQAGHFLEKSIIAIGFGNLPDLSNMDKVTIRAKYREKNPTASNKSIDIKVNEINSFVNGIKPDDIILMPLPGNKQLRIGHVIGEYEYDTNSDTDSDFRHIKKMDWHVNSFYMVELPLDIKKKIQIKTIVKIDIRDDDEQIENLLKNKMEESGKTYMPIHKYINQKNLTHGILRSLKKMNEIRAGDMAHHVADEMKIPNEARGYSYGAVTYLEFRLGFVMNNLKRGGLIINKKTGIWRLTSMGYAYMNQNQNIEDYTDDESIEEIECRDLLDDKLQIIIQGPPGTGKTRLANLIAGHITDENHITRITFHQSYSYEDFIEGLFPEEHAGNLQYRIKDGKLKEVAKQAAKDLSLKYIILIDEINRGNISKIFGEIITLIEKDKRVKKYATNLPYSSEKFFIPSNVFIVGTMNTADRSLINIDAALRRRFGFYDLNPDPSKLKKIDGVELPKLLDKINEKIRESEAPGKQIGHSYMLEVKSISDLQKKFRYEIIPLLENYFPNNYTLLQKILGRGFIDITNNKITTDWFNDVQLFKINLNKIIEGLE